jgi:ABC-type molybdate transport system substrate-binding protein
MRRFVSSGWFVLAVSAILFGAGAFALHTLTTPKTSNPTEPIVVQCADALRVPMEAIRVAYERETGQRVELRIGASQTLLTQMTVTQQGDLYLPADDSYLELARKKDLLRETLPVAEMHAVVIANPDARSPVKTWADFLAPERDIVLANPDAAAISKVVRQTLLKSGRWEEVEKRKPAFVGKVSEVGAAVRVNPKAVGIVWDAVAVQFPQLAAVDLPELAEAKSHVAVAVTTYAKDPTAALRFARFVTAKDKGLVEFAKNKYRVPERADVWAEHPELKLFGGSMLRPAIEDTVREFQAREGITVHTNWNGCGILVAEMKSQFYPDMYFACEPRFLGKVQDHFEPGHVISSNRLVIAVRKGNPHEVHSVKDLGKPGLKVGIGNENQCAMGDLTRMTFVRTGFYAKLQNNIAKQAPSGDTLISDFRSGGLDAIVVYESNVTPYASEFDFTPIDIGATNRDCTNPDQPVAVALATPYPTLAHRLMDAFRTKTSRERFEKLGFLWKD